MCLEEIWRERIFPRPEKKKNPLGCEKKEEEKKERPEDAESRWNMSPASWGVPGELGPQRMMSEDHLAKDARAWSVQRT